MYTFDWLLFIRLHDRRQTPFELALSSGLFCARFSVSSSSSLGMVMAHPLVTGFLKSAGNEYLRVMMLQTSSSVVFVVEVAADDSNPCPLSDFLTRRPLGQCIPTSAVALEDGDKSTDVATPLVGAELSWRGFKRFETIKASMALYK